MTALVLHPPAFHYPGEYAAPTTLGNFMLKNACILAFTKTWLGETDSNSEVVITGFGALLHTD